MLTLIKQSIKKIKASAFGLKYNFHWRNGDKRRGLYVKRKILATLRYNEHDISLILKMYSTQKSTPYQCALI